MFPVTVTLHNAGQLQAVIAALNAESAAPSGSPTTAPKSAKGQPAPSQTASATDAKTQSAITTHTGDAGNDVQTVSAQPTAEAPKDDAPAAKAVTYAELQAAVLKLHKADATAAKPIAEGMGFPNFKAMPDDKWAEALGKVEAELAKRGV